MGAMRGRSSTRTAIALLALFTVLPLQASLAQDVVPPTISGVHVRSTTEFSFELEWETNEPTRGGVLYGRSKELGMDFPQKGSGFATKHYLNVTGLDRNTKYYYQVYAEDLDGNVGYSGVDWVGTHPYDEGGFPWGGVIGILAVVVAVFVILFWLPRRAQ